MQLSTCAAILPLIKQKRMLEIAEKVNSIGVLNLVNALEKVDGKLIHISTDYVFDGNIFYHIKSQTQ